MIETTHKCDCCTLTITNTDKPGESRPQQGGIERKTFQIGVHKIQADLCQDCQDQTENIIQKAASLILNSCHGNLQHYDITFSLIPETINENS